MHLLVSGVTWISLACCSIGFITNIKQIFCDLKECGNNASNIYQIYIKKKRYVSKEAELNAKQQLKLYVFFKSIGKETIFIL